MSLEKSTVQPEPSKPSTDAIVELESRLFLVQRFASSWLGEPSISYFKDQAVLNGRQMVERMGFHPDYLAGLDFEEGENGFGDWVKVKRIKHLRVIQ